jgi:V/A-type H+/Na+-transporting ATPase subunit E
MAYEDLLAAVRANAQETMKEIRDRAEAEALRIRRDAEERAQGIRSAYLEEAKRTVQREKSKLISKAGAEKRMAFARAKEDLFQQVFDQAGRRLASARDRQGYRLLLKKIAGEAMEELPAEGIRVHVDPRDEQLAGEVLREMNRNCEVVADLSTMGGLNATTADDRLMIFNTLESRLERARELMKSEIMSTLYGD